MSDKDTFLCKKLKSLVWNLRQDSIYEKQISVNTYKVSEMIISEINLLKHHITKIIFKIHK